MEKEKAIFFPGLNGIRAIAALAVVLSHLTKELERFGLNPHLFGTMENGNPRGLDLAEFGVTIFFALSGFLITYLLLAEDNKKPINIRNFYVRRILRIWPLYYTYFLIALFFTFLWSGEYNMHIGSTAFYIFFAANVPKILSTQIPLLSHYWSLGVEEQFYMIWPVWVKKTIKRILILTIIGIGIFLGVKVFAHTFYPGSFFEMAMYIVKFDCMMIGALGAILYYKRDKLFMQIVPGGIAQAIAWVALGFVAINQFHIFSIIDHEIISGVTVVLIVGQIEGRRKLINLDKEWLDFLGKISYGLYVIHPIVLYGLGRLIGDTVIGPQWLKYIVVYTSVVGLTVLLSHLSYEYLEKRFLRMKDRFSTVKSTGSRHFREEVEEKKEEGEMTAAPR